jgi:hypothetical protein
MGLDFELINGQTPLDEEEKDGLLIPTITTRGELDEFEQQSIERAIIWTMGRKFKTENMLTEDFVKLCRHSVSGLRDSVLVDSHGNPTESPWRETLRGRKARGRKASSGRHKSPEICASCGNPTESPGRETLRGRKTIND